MRTYFTLVTSLLLLVILYTPAAAEGVEIRLLEPMPEAVILGNSITVIFEVDGAKIVPSSVPVHGAGMHSDMNRPDEGHIHLMLDLQPLVIWSEDKPYTFTNVAAGEHLLTVEFVNNDHSSLTPPAVAQRRVQVRHDPVAPAAGTAPMLPNTGPEHERVMNAFEHNIRITRWHVLLLCAAELVSIGFFVRRVPGLLGRLRARR